MSVTTPRGFRAGGIAAGIKAGGARDLALVVNDGPTDTAAAVFTTNRVKAAPVLWTEQVIADQRLRAVVLNSGGANACTGPEGFADTHRTAEAVAAALGLGAGEVAVCSTGLIGERLPMAALLAGVDRLAAAITDTGSGADLDAGTEPDIGGAAAADAIRTTDSVAKQASRSVGNWTIGGMAKGAGMLAPGLATMLCVLTTDAQLDPFTADQALRSASRQTFDRVDADGCMSTNDTVILLASGASGATPGAAEFAETLRAVCADLAAQLIHDAEGATKEIRVEVTGAAEERDAVVVGRSIARNTLVKCALFGNDPNWGRVLAAIGTTDAAFDPDRLDVAMNGVTVCRAGAAGDDRSRVDLSGRSVHIEVGLNAGTETATIWTTDLSHAYVEENSAYSS